MCVSEGESASEEVGEEMSEGVRCMTEEGGVWASR